MIESEVDADTVENPPNLRSRTPDALYHSPPVYVYELVAYAPRPSFVVILLATNRLIAAPGFDVFDAEFIYVTAVPPPLGFVMFVRTSCCICPLMKLAYSLKAKLPALHFVIYAGSVYAVLVAQPLPVLRN